MHSLDLLVTLAGGLAFALVFGWATQKAGLSTLVGYMMAGIVVGPYTPGFVADVELAQQMSEIGVVLLMFGVGMHFHPQELLRVWRIAVPGAVGQSALAAVAGWALARAFGWSHPAGIVFGMALAVASTVVLMRMLVERNRLSSRDGHVAVGWLIVEDLFTVAALVVLPVLALDKPEAGALGGEVLAALGKAIVFALLVALLGVRLVSRLLERVARSAELFTLTVFVVALGVAVLAAEVFHVSVALGAFFAGLVVGQSRFGPQAAADMAPFRDVFSSLFFVSIGMLFNPRVVVEDPLLIVGALAVVLLLKPLVALAIVLALRDTPRTAATVAVGLAQIGEFSFILATVGASVGVLPGQAMDALVVAAILSIAVNPVLFRLSEAVFERRERRVAAPSVPADRDADRPSVAGRDGAGAAVVIAGYRGLGRRLAGRASSAGVPLAVIDADASDAHQSEAPDVSFVYGDPTRAEVLAAAGVRDARILVLADLTLPQKMQVFANARRLNPRISVIGAASNDAERAWLEEIGARFICDALDEQTEQIARAIRANL